MEEQLNIAQITRADSRKWHFIYKTTCLVTGYWYIGMHSTNNLDDGYLGSGKRLWYSFQKHGEKNHIREILEFCIDRKSLAAREKEIVNEEMLKEERCMNLMIGGHGGWETWNNDSELQKSKGKRGHEKMKWLRENDDEWIKAKTDKCKKTIKERFPGGVGFISQQNEMCRRAATPKAIEKRKATFADRKHQQGEKNSGYNTKWITNGVNVIKIHIDELDKMLELGWRKGRKLNQ